MGKANKKVRVMLINPQQKIYNNSYKSGLYFPIGLMYVASMIRDKCDLKLFDCMIEDFKIERFEDYEIIGCPLKYLKNAILDFDPQIVGITIPFTSQSENAINVCEIAKSISKEIIVIFGGPDPSVRYEKLLNDTDVDYCVVGEGEDTMVDIIESYKSNRQINEVQGVAYRGEKGIQKNDRPFIADLDRLPIPAYDLIDFNKYQESDLLYAGRMFEPNKITIVSSRGCPFKCTFCSISLSMGRPFRYHSVLYTINHMKYLMKNYGIKTFHFEDDNVSLNKKRFSELLDAIIFENLNIRWSVPNGLRADTLNTEIIDKIQKSGCTEVRVGLESGNQEVLDKIIKKSTNLEYEIEMLKYCHKISLPTSAFWIIGFPEETIENMKETIDVALNLYQEYGVKPLMSIATPLYGTELYRESKKNGFLNNNLTDMDFAQATNSSKPKTMIQYAENFSPADVTKLTEEYYRRYNKIRLGKIKSKRNKKIKKRISRFIRNPKAVLKRYLINY
tara:strand:- start:2567 stop:4078 length:1512 start_codon:yes stop_codon:yes gene_type:complete